MFIYIYIYKRNKTLAQLCENKNIKNIDAKSIIMIYIQFNSESKMFRTPARLRGSRSSFELKIQTI